MTTPASASIRTASSGEELVRALAEAPAGAVIALDAASYHLADNLVLTRPLTLCGTGAEPPILHFADGRYGLSVTAPGCRLEAFAITASEHRGTALVEIAADDCTLDRILLLRLQGAGIRVQDCRGLVAHDLVAEDIGQEALAAFRCHGLRIALRARAIARRAASPALRLVDCRDLAVEIDVDDVQGSAVTVERGEVAPADIKGRLAIRARRVQRGLSLLGSREAPAGGLQARVEAREWTDCAVLLSNARDIDLRLAVDTVARPSVIRLNGGFGLCDSTIVVTSPPEAGAGVPAGLVTGSGRNRNNTIQHLVTAPEAEAATEIAPEPAPLASPALAQRLREIGNSDFHVYELPGRCGVCGWQGRFRRTHRSERETLACSNCRATLRYRGQAEVIVEQLGDGRFADLAGLAAGGGLAGLAVFEPGVAGPLRPSLRKAGRYEQSFYDPDVPSGTRRDGLICQDLMAMSFAEASFDLVVTSDIFEHVRRPFAAFAEIRRILRPGGRHIWTVPIGMPPPAETRARVDTSGPEDRMLLPPVYHGSGTDGLSLVYTDFGRDIGQRLAAIGLPTHSVRHVLDAGHVAAVTFVSIRPPEPPAAGPG